MSVEVNAPIYHAGDIIDIAIAKTGMPDRLYVNMVYMKDKSTEWMYAVESERTANTLFCSESQLVECASKKDDYCYETDAVKEMYEAGYRFCGNASKEKAYARAKNLAKSHNIKHVVLRNAIDKDGTELLTEYGIWVQYNVSFRDVANDGKIVVK